MAYVDEITARRRNSRFQKEYAAHGPSLADRTGKCFCCGRSFDYCEALNRFEMFIEQRDGDFFSMDAFGAEICADCAIRTLKNSTWMEIL